MILDMRPEIRKEAAAFDKQTSWQRFVLVNLKFTTKIIFVLLARLA